MSYRSNLCDSLIVDRLQRLGPVKEVVPPIPGRLNFGAKTCFCRKMRRVNSSKVPNT